jgi:vesicle coat complex subunit
MLALHKTIVCFYYRRKESEINQLIDVMSTLHSVNIPDDNENFDTEFLKPGATYVKSQSDLSNSPSVIIPVIERETEYNTTIQLRAAQNHQMGNWQTVYGLYIFGELKR